MDARAAALARSSESLVMNVLMTRASSTLGTWFPRKSAGTGDGGKADLFLPNRKLILQTLDSVLQAK
jgi:hypothetical protein